MILLRLIFASCLANAAIQGFSQSNKLPLEAKPFVLQGYEMMDYITGDLNGDKKIDAILILKIMGEDTINKEVNRPFIILIRQPNGKLRFEKRNDSMIMCRQCGGVYGDPYQPTTIENNVFDLSFYGGSSDRWTYEYFFSYNPVKKNWMLSKETDVTYRSLDPEHTAQETVIGASELQGISVDNFNCIPADYDDKWKVTATKAFFYNSPQIGSKQRKGYLLKDDEVSGMRELTNFVEITFQNSKKQITSGYVLKKDMAKIK